ncbi:hypothetical protein BD779DRAFT_1677568 [Infundibulicybe gibba]|nr:hypothetical protein BD779DRAFT_1677568 [Infundibulicybe gibba]
MPKDRRASVLSSAFHVLIYVTATLVDVFRCSALTPHLTPYSATFTYPPNVVVRESVYATGLLNGRQHAQLRRKGGGAEKIDPPMYEAVRPRQHFDPPQALSQNGTFRATINRLISVLPPTEYAVDERALSRVTVPPKPNGATPARYPDGWSQCLVTNEIKNKIPSTPGFPAPLVHPPKAHRIDSAPGKGLGIFATRDLDMGDLICVERPLLVLPSCTTHVKIGYPRDWTKEQLGRAMTFVWGQQCYRVFERLEPETQNPFLSLANIHTEDGSWTVHGIRRTNSFGIEELVDIVGTSEAPYTGVCKEFSRANHGCGPNVTRYFNLKSFAFYFSAVRPTVKAEEEMTVAYGVLGDIRSVRQQDHQKYKFDCDCPACGPDFEVSDQNGLDIMVSAGDLDANYAAWLKDKMLPKEKLIKTSLWWIKQ